MTNALQQVLDGPSRRPVDVRPIAKRLKRSPFFLGAQVEEATPGRPHAVDAEGRWWILDGSGEVA